MCKDVEVDRGFYAIHDTLIGVLPDVMRAGTGHYRQIDIIMGEEQSVAVEPRSEIPVIEFRIGIQDQ